jgi:DNA-binding transcriptional LysR family regulator
VHIQSGLSGQLLDAVQRRELDAAVVGWRSPLDGATTGLRIFSDRMVLAVPRDLAERLGGVRSLRELAGQAFILFPRASSPSYYDALVRVLRDADIKIGALGTEATDSPTIIGLVSAGLGCAVVPLSYQVHCPANVILQEVDDLRIAFDLELVWHSEASDPLLEAFVSGWHDGE